MATYKRDYAFEGIGKQNWKDFAYLEFAGFVANAATYDVDLPSGFDPQLPPKLQVFEVTAGPIVGVMGGALDISAATLGADATLIFTIDGTSYTFNLENENGISIPVMAAATAAQVATAINKIAGEFGVGDKIWAYDDGVTTLYVVPFSGEEDGSVVLTGGTAAQGVGGSELFPAPLVLPATSTYTDFTYADHTADFDGWTYDPAGGTNGRAVITNGSGGALNIAVRVMV